MIEEALKYPFKGDKWLEKAVYGYILALASFLIIPAPLLIGYMVRVMREDSMPSFSNPIQMYLDGLKALLMFIIYIVPGITLAALLDGGAALTGILAFLVGFYSLESGVYQLANNGFKATLTLQVLKDAFTAKYFIGALASFLITFFIVMAWFFSLVLIFTLLLYPLVQFYQNVIRYRIYTEAIESE